VNLWTKKTEMKDCPTKNQLSQEEVHTAVGLIQWPFDTMNSHIVISLWCLKIKVHRSYLCAE